MPFEADRAAQVLPDPDVVVVPIVAVHGAAVPWGKVVVEGVPVVAARRLPSMLRQLPAVLEPERVAVLADQARVRFHAAVLPPGGLSGGYPPWCWWPDAVSWISRWLCRSFHPDLNGLVVDFVFHLHDLSPLAFLDHGGDAVPV